jgi:hypothetical protein
MQTSLFTEITFTKIKIIADAGQQPIDKIGTKQKLSKSKKPSRFLNKFKNGKLFIGLTTKPATLYKGVAKQHN